MKLAVEVTTCTEGRAGIGYYTEHLVDALLATRRADDQVALIGNGSLAPEPSRKWAGLLHLGGASVRYLWMQAHAPRLLAVAGADLAVFPNYLAPLGAPCPYVNIVHDLALFRTPEYFTMRKQALLRPLLPLVAQSAVAVGTVSEASRRDVMSVLGVPEHRILMLPGAPHPSCRPPDGETVAGVRARYGLSRPYVLSVGTLEPRKNLPTLLRAFDRLLARAGTAAAGLDLVIVGGRGWRDRELRAEIDRRLADGRVHVLGYVPEADLVALYGGATVMAYPSHFEGFGLPVLEAMACGTPVVASDVPALREISGGAAVQVIPGDDRALAEAIAHLVEDPAACEAARARGLARAGDFRWEKTAERLWAFAREVHARRRPARAPARGAERAPAPAPAGPVPGAGTAHDGARDGWAADWAVLATVAYADLFDASIQTDEAARACLGHHMSADEVARRVATQPLGRFVVATPGGHLTLRGREHLAARRAEGIRRTEELLHRHRHVIAALASLPFIRMLALSGGTAHRNARGGDDVDLFVVSAPGHAYTAYTMLFLASQLTRTRGIVCPNYLVDEDHLRIAYNHDLFTAHQAISLVPVAGHDAFARFVAANDDWVSSFFPSYAPRPPDGRLGIPRLQRLFERGLGGLGVPIETVLHTAWRLHLGRRAMKAAPGADVVLERGILKLHLSDHRRKVLARFGERLDALRAAWEEAAATEAAPAAQRSVAG